MATVAGASVAPPITVRVADASGATVTGAMNPITLSLASNPGGVPLYGSLTVSAVNGVATFSDIKVNRAAIGYQLGASTSGLTSATSNGFNITARPKPTPDLDEPNLAATRIYSAGSQSLALAYGDMNGDGVRDLVVANRASNSVSILHGRASGAFGSRTDLTVGSAPYDVTVADLNGDGKLDIVVALSGGNGVALLLQSPTSPGAFLAAAFFAAGTGPDGVVVADMNGDGAPDIVVSNESSANISLLLQDGANPGTFRAPIQMPVGTNPRALAVADLNGDGKPDILVADRSAGAWVILHDPASTTGFLAPVGYSAGSQPVSITIADLDGDGRLDFVIANHSSSSVSVFLQDPARAGVFLAGASYGTGAAPNAVKIADVNRDGKIDLVTADQGSNTFSVLLQDSVRPGVFLAPVAYLGAGAPSGLALGDFDGDGHIDVAVANRDTNDVYITLQDPASAGQFLVGPGYTSGTHPRAVVAADLNGDGKLDVLVPNFDASSLTVFLHAPTPGGFLAPRSYAAGQNPAFVAVGDLDGDTLPDLVVSNYGADTLTIFVQDAANRGQFLAPRNVTVGSGPHRIVITDLNGDGKLDLVVACTFGEWAAVLLQDPAIPGTFLPLRTLAAGSNPTDLVVADLNGDGSPDLVVAATGAVVVLLQDPASPGSFQPATSFAAQTSVNSIAAADIDGDGKLDVAVANRDTNDVSVFKGVGDGSFRPRVDIAAGSHPWDVRIADVNGDGRPDLVAANFGSNFGSPDLSSSVMILLQDPNSPGSFVAGPIYKAGLNPEHCAIGDFNGDGKFDLAVSNWASNNVQILAGR